MEFYLRAKGSIIGNFPRPSNTFRFVGSYS